MNLAKLHGFQVYLINSPICDQLRQDPQFQTYYKSLRKWQSDLENSHKQLTVLDDELPFGLPATAMNGTDHANHDGARLYTEFVCNQIDREFKRQR